MKYTVTKVFTFDSGHRLSNYDGKCKQLHGHTYHLELTVGCEELDSLGMVLDFNVLKDIYKQEVDSLLDHRLMLYEDDTANQVLARNLPVGDKSVVFTSFNPTAENIGRFLFSLFQSRLPGDRGLRVDRLTLYETPTSFATIHSRPEEPLSAYITTGTGGV